MKLPPALAAKCAALSTTTRKQGQAERVTVPVPPSANGLFLSVGRKRVKSPEYRSWLKVVAPLFAELRPPESYPCVMLYLISGKVNQRRDGFNVEKGLTDAIVAAGVITDDSLKYLRGGCWQYEPGEWEPSVTVWFEGMIPQEEAK